MLSSSTLTLSLSLLIAIPELLEASNLTLETTCTCSGYEVVYRCNVVGLGITVWQGTLFNICHDGTITLRHTEFSGDVGTSITRMCSTGGEINGRSIGVTDNVFTSQLTINVSDDMQGKTVECLHNSGSSINIVGTSQILLTTGSFPSPNNVTLSMINDRQLNFIWSPSTNNCPALHYNIIASNCGNCPRITVSNSVICTDVSIGTTPLINTCTFIVQTAVCNDILGTTSAPLVILIKVPSITNMVATPEYSGETGSLSKILLNFSEPEQFSISDGIDGSAISYFISYADALSSGICGSTTIQSSSCSDGECSHVFEISTSACPPFTNISNYSDCNQCIRSGTTIGPNPGGLNHLVQLQFHSNSVNCTFLTLRDGTVKSCEIMYGQREKNTSQCSSFSLRGSEGPTVSNKLTIPLQSISGVSSYCYLLRANSGSMTIHIRGMFTIACDLAQLSDHEVTSVSNSSVCGTSYSALKVENGIICYSGNEVGSIAVYFSMDCCYKLLQTRMTLIRTCGQGGQWDGTIPSCNRCICAADDITSNSISISISLAIIIITIITIFITIVSILIRERIKLKAELKRERSNKLYEEIDPIHQVDTKTTENIAYSGINNDQIPVPEL